MKRAFCLLVFAALAVGAEVPLRGQGNSFTGPSPANAPNAVSAGTRFIVGLQDNLGTKDSKNGDRFHARTLEPLTTANGADSVARHGSSRPRG